MKVQLGHIVQNLFHAGSLDDVPVSRLQELAETHPYFGTGHLLLSQKLKHQQSTDFDAQVQKTALYFHDPLWLHWQLGQQEKVAVADDVEVAKPVTTIIPEAPVYVEQESEPVVFEDTEPEIQPDLEPEVQEEVEPEPEIQPGTGLEPEPEAQPGTSFEPGQEPAKTAEPEEGTGSIYEPDSIEPPAQPNPEADPPPPPVEDEPTSEAVELPAPETQEQAPITEPVKAEAETKEPAFEPYHTVDYFASQGIKVSNEVQPTDRLGKQLKSFTEWLKTMKRLPQTAQDAQNDENGDQDIRRIAATSLQEKEVVTETMAEVLVKQDKRGDAIAIYEKLSLLDPSKRAYFAAKIENLKEN